MPRPGRLGHPAPLTMLLPGLLLAFLAIGAIGALLLAGCVAIRPFAEIRKEVPASRFVEVAGQLVHVEQAGAGEPAGDPAGDPVLLVHGFGASTYSWRKVMPDIARSRRAIALDLSGFGYTERPRDPERYSRDGQVALILGLLDALGIERAHLVGHSYGGALSLALAARHPDRVRSLLLLDSAAPTYPNDRRTRLAGIRWLNGLFLRSVALREKGVRRALQASVSDDSLVTPKLVAAYLDRLRIEGISHAYYGLTAPVRNPGEAVELGKITAPTLVIWGAEDRLIPLEDGRQATARIPGARFEVFEQTGHMPMEERPEDVLRLAGEFWAGVEGTPAN